MRYTHPFTSVQAMTNDDIKNIYGASMGNIQDIVIDTQTDQVISYILSMNKSGARNELYAVPPQALVIDVEEECMVLNLVREQLQQAPRFDRREWPYAADALWDKTGGIL